MILNQDYIQPVLLTVGFSFWFKQDAPNGIFTGCLMWPHLFPLYASQIFKLSSLRN